jgi:hypothetical protein
MGCALGQVVKSVHIEFIQSRRARTVWAIAAFLSLCVLGGVAWRWGEIDRAVRNEREQISAAQLQLQKLNKPVQKKADPRQVSVEKAVQLLRQDLNKVFATAENLREPGVRLRGLNLEAAANSLRLEYELDSMVKASVVTEALNNGYELRPWQLESVSGTSEGRPPGSVAVVPAAPVFQGIWLSQFGAL